MIDCVLSLNRRYDAFVVPRLDRFERAYPGVMSVRSLRALIDSFPTPGDFVFAALDYKDRARAVTLSMVVDFVLGIIGNRSPEEELRCLEPWARGADPAGYKELRIPGFGIAGFQYLRMLFGGDTTKPDVHIRRYVGDQLARTVSDVDALRLLEAAAQASGVRIRDVDTSIWEKRARTDSIQRAF